jgi:tryptophan-rich sensory protein
MLKLAGSITGITLVLIYIVGSGLWVNTGDNWYRSLNAPNWQPPDFIFGIIWPYNFVVLGVAAVNVSQRLSAAWVISYLSIFALSVACALTWAYQFYQPHNLSAASVALTLVALLTFPVLLIAFKASVGVGLLLVPYQLWVIAATTISWGYAKLN